MIFFFFKASNYILACCSVNADCSCHENQKIKDEDTSLIIGRELGNKENKTCSRTQNLLYFCGRELQILLLSFSCFFPYDRLNIFRNISP